MTRNIPLREPRSSVSEEVPPFPFERLERSGILEPRISFRHRVHRHVGLQSATPLSQRPRVMRSVVLDKLNREPVLRAFGRGVYQGSGARERGVGPHVTAHEVLRLVSPVSSFWECRGGDDCGGILVLQSPVDELEVGLVVLSSYMLKEVERMGQRSEGRNESVMLTSSISTLTKASKRPAHSRGISR